MSSSDDGDSGPTCNMPNPLASDGEEPFIGDLSFREFNMAIAGGATAVVCLSIFILMARHATHYSKPNEQGKIMKICLLLPFYSIFSFLGIAYPNAYMYLDPWRSFWEAIALGTFFLLLCEYVSPSADFRDVFFAALEVPAARRAREKGRPVKTTGLEWYRKRWICVFQYPPVSLGVAIATAITQAADRYCLESSNVRFSHIWLTIIHNVSLVIAVISCVRFYNVLKKDMQHHKPLVKFLSFKLIVGMTFVEQIVFTILRSTGTLEESSKLTYADVNFGIESMITCLLLIPFSLFFHYSYSVSPYDITKPRMLPLSEIPPEYNRPSGEHEADQHASESTAFNGQRHMAQRQQDEAHYQGGRLGIKAWANVFNPQEMLRAISFAFTMRTQARRRQRRAVANNESGSTLPDYGA